MAILILLDLDHTLIYGSYATNETAELLFQHNAYLKVYKRPLAETLVQVCQSKGTVIVYTTALRDYAKTICSQLAIDPKLVLTRKDCKLINGKHKKVVRPEWLEQYDRIVIIDDSPNLWLNHAENIAFLVPDEFRGKADDYGLQTIIDQLKCY